MLAKYPPMGWNSWDCYGTAVTEADVRRNAEYMSDKLKDFGWEYVVVDIQWYQPAAIDHNYQPFSDVTMDKYGRLMPAVNRFPSAAEGAGFKPLADYVHSLGLKFGIHIMRGIPRMAAHRHLPIKSFQAVDGMQYSCDQAADPNSICQWNPDMYGARQDHPAAGAYYESIFRLYAEWGVDFVKCDDIAREYPHCRREIELISQACRSCGRDIVLSLSPGPAPVEEAQHLKQYANMWRITDDFWDDWNLLKGMFERAEKWCIHSGPGHWPDADMLPVGALRLCGEETAAGRFTRFTEDEQRTMMTLWCMMRSPLFIGGNLPMNDAFTLEILTNRELLAIERENYCARPLFTSDSAAAWIAPRIDGSGCCVAVFNLSEEEQDMSIDTEEIERQYSSAKELWKGTEAEDPTVLSAKLPPHGCAVWKLSD